MITKTLVVFLQMIDIYIFSNSPIMLGLFTHFNTYVSVFIFCFAKILSICFRLLLFKMLTLYLISFLDFLLLLFSPFIPMLSS